MEKSERSQILLIDNDVLVNLFDDLFSTDKTAFQSAFAQLAVSFPAMWIPKTVEDEFTLKNQNRLRAKRLRKIMAEFPGVQRCPIRVGKHEIAALVGSNDDDAGEADAILQARKAMSGTGFHFSNIVFFSNDRLGLQLASEMGVKTYPYKNFINLMKEVGIALPS